MTEERAVVVSEGPGLLTGLQTVREVLAPDLSDAELQLFAMVASRSGLDPFAKQIYAIKRNGKLGFQTGIDGLRSIAVRTGEYDGQDEPTYGPDCDCGKKPMHPESATVKVYRKGMSRPVGATAFWHEYIPDAGASGRGDVMWRKMPHVMLGKVAEALALRKGFPWDPTANTGIGGDIYTAEEMAQADNAPVRAGLADRIAERAGGISLRQFRDDTEGLPGPDIGEMARKMFPQAEKLSDLSAAERMELRDALLNPGHDEAPEGSEDEADGGPDGTPLVEQTEAETVEVVEVVVETTVEVETDGCLSVSPFHGTGDQVTCTLKAGHRGIHRAGESETWPR